MNYNSVNEILEAGITNMTILRNNSRQDDDNDTITGVDWFVFNGIVANNIYANGNSWFGFGSKSEHLKINRRDAAMYYLYREEGTLYNYYKFLKIRWVGYSYYNSTIPAYSLSYDVILWDTGDISLHMITIPTDYNNGVYSLVASSTYSYTVSTSIPNVTFKKTDSGFEINNSIISLNRPYNEHYLIRDGSNYYTIENNNLKNITITDLTSTIFLENGIETIPDISLLLTLTNPELLYWNDGGYIPSKGLIIYGNPSVPQIVEYKSQDISSYTGIERAEILNTKDVLFALSFDDGTTWKYYDGSAWQTTTSKSEGMTPETVYQILPAVWAEVFTPTTLKFRAILTTLSSTAGKIYIKYI